MIYGDGEHSRDFTFVANAVHANLLAARKPEPIGGEVMNVGCGGRISLNRLASQMGQELGRPDLTPVYEHERAGDIRHSYADLAGARDAGIRTGGGIQGGVAGDVELVSVDPGSSSSDCRLKLMP